MNKMNIPAPFRMALPTPPLPPSVTATQQPPLPPSVPEPPALQPPPPPMADKSSSESEMESSDEVISFCKDVIYQPEYNVILKNLTSAF